MKTKLFLLMFFAFASFLALRAGSTELRKDFSGTDDKYCVADATYEGLYYTSEPQVDCNTALYILYGKLCDAGWDHENCDLYN